MLRNVIAVIIGLFAGMALNMGILEINYLAYPIPEGLDINNPAQLQDYLDTLPALAFLAVMAAHLAQSFGGGWVAARLGSSRPMLLAMIVGSALTGVVLRGLTFVHGDFTLPVLLHLGLVAFPVLLHLGGAWVAGIMEQKRRAAGDTPTPAFAETAKAE